MKSIYAQRFGGQVLLAAQEPAVEGGAKSTLLMDEDSERDTESSQIRFTHLPRGESVTLPETPVQSTAAALRIAASTNGCRDIC